MWRPLGSHRPPPWQTPKERQRLLAPFLLPNDWKLDKAIPYPFTAGKNTINNPGSGVELPDDAPPNASAPGKNASFTDTPGTPIRRFHNSILASLVQDFELHFVCMAGPEKGATYGGVKWGHEFSVQSYQLAKKSDIAGYKQTSYAKPISGPPSNEWLTIWKAESE